MSIPNSLTNPSQKSLNILYESKKAEGIKTNSKKPGYGESLLNFKYKTFMGVGDSE